MYARDILCVVSAHLVNWFVSGDFTNSSTAGTRTSYYCFAQRMSSVKGGRYSWRDIGHACQGT